VARLIDTEITNSIKTKVPRYEALEWYVKSGNKDGKTWYIAYVLVRFPRKDIIDMIEGIDPEKIIEAVMLKGIRAGQFSEAKATGEVKSALVVVIEGARAYALDGVRDGTAGH
jgi:hypothetical protein